MRFDTDSIQILTIRFKRRDLNRNLEVMVEIEYSFSLGLLTTQSDPVASPASGHVPPGV